MARINKTDVIQKAVNDLALSQSTDKIPNETLDKVQLVYGLNRHFSDFCVHQTTNATGTMTVTMPTIDARSEIYITNINFSYAKDATCDIATGSLQANLTTALQGIVKIIGQLALITLTAQQDSINISLPYPIKVKPNTNVTLGGTFSLGVMVRNMSVTGFITSSN